MNIIKQREGKIQNEGARIYIEDKELPFVPEERYNVEIYTDKNIVEVIADADGEYKVSKRVRKNKGDVIPVIDKKNPQIKEALESCSFVKITFYIDESGKGRVVFEGIKETATIINEKRRESTPRQLTSITFCAGAGLSSFCNEKVGFKEMAAVEYNPKIGSNDRFSEVFSINHPDTIMFNIPMERVSADDLPDVDFWLATLDCSDFSKAKNNGEYATMHLFVHLMRLFYQKPKDKRPKAIMIENVEGFEKVAGNTLNLCLREEGYTVKMAKLNSLDYGSRTQRVRFFLVATVYDGFEFPEATGRLTDPIVEDGIITLDNLDWTTPEENNILKYYIDRTHKIKKGKVSHNFRVSTIDITKDAYVGTITKSFHKGKAENIIKHPTEEKYAFLHNVDHLKYIHGVDPEYYVGDGKAIGIESIGQGICSTTFTKIVKNIHDVLYRNIIEPSNSIIFKAKEFIEEKSTLIGYKELDLDEKMTQLCFVV
ncbi:DNA cytosine methyltransferase [Alkaliphilus sp. B6464]|uniref:DNA cytosine methyltransferase n=1 Tax=Alkaliphilus sp. B6464 TaxID=2731219 RepID=UPI001BAADFB3|nr:DNA cytosine methyltransferase [Alkaliphilus sp. B6464]QUH21791.1 DNA cytosine methyltransferase [Alkaliphilus sp. B6464]